MKVNVYLVEKCKHLNNNNFWRKTMKKNLLLITALLAGNNALFCMEKPASNSSKIAVDKQNTCINYIDVDPKPMIYHGGPNLRFYGEYRSRPLENGLVSFPVNACDPLPLNTFGPIRYFFLSATGGNTLAMGSAIKVEDPTITNIVVVRGKDVSGCRMEAYLGYNKHDFKTKGKNKICIAQLLAINTKDIRCAQTQPTIFAPVTGYLSNADLSREICNRLENIKDRDWRSPIFKQTMLELLGEGWVLREGYGSWSCTCDEAVVSNIGIYTNKIYWTQEENKLKDFNYKNKN